MGEDLGFVQDPGLIREYMERQLPALAVKLGLDAEGIETLRGLATVSFLDEVRSGDDPGAGVCIGSQASSRMLVRFLLERFVTEGGILGKGHLSWAMQYRRQGGRIALVCNHTGNADGPIIDYFLGEALRDRFPETEGKLWFVAGHMVWQHPFLRMFSRSVNMIRVVSRKYIEDATAKGDHEKVAEMRRQNMAMFSHLRHEAADRNDIICFFPEGTRNRTGQLNRGVSETMSILHVMQKANPGPQGVMILPCCIEGAASMLPDVEDTLEFYRFLEAVRKGKVFLHIGSPVLLRDLMDRIPEGISKQDADRLLVDDLMPRIARFIPDDLRGPYRLGYD
ncbi:MAG: 1-acyl-sn-glycerol-3-phosphate acyltransferase [Candidatus Moranbacteria bacterium]|nr:1-acyl-sn-glycerol-3-phosphate acyltransferase [Candidatus Moranbacteria bacterium]